jgi:tetratricopeptide (TPR) repeat protein
MRFGARNICGRLRYPGAVVLLAVLCSAGAARVFAQPSASQYDMIVSRAASARAENNTQLAIELYSQAVQIRPDSKEAWFYLGLVEYGANHFSAAIGAFGKLLELDRNFAPALAMRGMCEFESGAYDAALRDLQEGLAKGAATDPNNEKIIRYHVAELLILAGHFDEAVAQFQFFAAHGMNDPDLQLALGLAGMRMPVLPGGLDSADRPLVEAVGKAGMALLSDEPDSADEQFKELFVRYPQANEIPLFYGRLLFRHSPEMAINAFQKAVMRSPSDTYAHAELAFTLMIAGRYADATPEAERALAVIPSMTMAQLALGVSLAESGAETNRALVLLKHVLEQDPNDLEAHMGLAALYSREGRREDAYRERMLCLGLEREK